MLSVDRPSTECRPITDRYIGQVSTNYRPTIGEVSAKCRCNVGEVSAKSQRSVGERKAVSAETHLERLSTVSRPSVDLLSTDYQLLYRPTVDRVSTECRPSVDRLSTECRPLYRPISRSTLPTVNKIQVFWAVMNAISSFTFLLLRFSVANDVTCHAKYNHVVNVTS